MLCRESELGQCAGKALPRFIQKNQAPPVE